MYYREHIQSNQDHIRGKQTNEFNKNKKQKEEKCFASRKKKDNNCFLFYFYVVRDK
jgi:hypothetical protein